MHQFIAQVTCSRIQIIESIGLEKTSKIIWSSLNPFILLLIEFHYVVKTKSGLTMRTHS